jgi:hypothetical protein
LGPASIVENGRRSLSRFPASPSRTHRGNGDREVPPREWRNNDAKRRRSEQWVKDFYRRYQRTQAAYMKLASIGQAAEVASLARLGMLHEAFMREADRESQTLWCGPGGELYASRHCLLQNPFEDRALDAYKQCAELARERGLDEWWQICDAALSRMKPFDYPVMSEIFREPAAVSSMQR